MVVVYVLFGFISIIFPLLSFLRLFVSLPLDDITKLLFGLLFLDKSDGIEGGGGEMFPLLIL